ncbi:MAG: AI-2E family transporter [Treponema sp.]|nr:AI-2E family transporter [Treponema sp.]
MEEKDYSKAIFYILFFLAIIAIGTLCKLLSSVILPVVVAVLMTFSFMPVILKLNRKLKIPWILLVIIIDIILLFAIFALSSLLVSSLSTIIAEYPKYESRFMSIYKLTAATFNLQFDDGKSFIDNLWSVLQVREYVQKLAVFLSSGLFTFAKYFLVIILLFTFLLIEIKSTGKKINSAFHSKTRSKVFRIIQQVISETVRYLSIKFFISLATGILVFIGTSIVGMDFPIVWGFLAFIMNFIPTFGSIISTLLTTLFATLQFYPAWGKIIYIFILLLSINMILGNILEPRIEGNHLGLSPFVILVSLSLWGWLWGFVGMILAVPMTVIIKIVCENFSILNPIAVLLGNGIARKTPQSKTADTKVPQQEESTEEDISK